MVQLRDIAAAIDAQLTGDATGEVSAITPVSSNCNPGDIFVAIKGFRVDGNDFVTQAIAQGAIAIISQHPCPKDFTHTWLQVSDARRALSAAAAVVYHYPSRALKLVGITGTNGKTTTAYLMDAIFRANFQTSAMVTTICKRIGEKVETATRTTPEASDTQLFLRKAVDAGCHSAVMEVSSQAIDLHRVDDLDFAGVIFTNLTQDHLDYHKTMENYFAAKKRLFDGSLNTSNATAAINIDSDYGQRLQNIFKGKALTFGFSDRADIHLLNYQLSLNGLQLKLATLNGVLEISSALVGKPNIYNILAATASAISLGIESTTIVRGIESLSCVPGRFERVNPQEDFAVVVDYAHTDDALHNVLATVREITNGRIICLFGCGGDKDRSKRPLMAKAAASHSDLVIITSDNPRSEVPEQIMNEAEAGLKDLSTPYHKIVDRTEAIQFAVTQASKGDIVVIAGKGHENYQIFIDRTIHFDDKEVAGEALQNRRTAFSSN